MCVMFLWPRGLALNANGKVALVTGGANGLGLAIAEYLMSMGAVTVVADVDKDALGKISPRLDGRQVDVTNQEAVQGLVDGVVREHGRVDILVNNAGVIFSEPFVNVMNPNGIMHDYDAFRQNLLVNLDSVFLVSSAAVEQMVRSRSGGVIVNISSISAKGNEGQTAYSAAKSAVNALTLTWARELGRWGIRVNAVAPGFIDTPSTRQSLSQAIVEHVESATPLRRLGTPREIAQAVGAVIENEFISGAILDVNGGLRF